MPLRVALSIREHELKTSCYELLKSLPADHEFSFRLAGLDGVYMTMCFHFAVLPMVVDTNKLVRHFIQCCALVCRTIKLQVRCMSLNGALLAGCELHFKMF